MVIKLRDLCSNDLNLSAGCFLQELELPSTSLLHIENLRQPLDPMAAQALRAPSTNAQQRSKSPGSFPSTGSRRCRAYTLSALRITPATESSVLTSSLIGPGLPKTSTVMSILLLLLFFLRAIEREDERKLEAFACN